MSTNDVQSTAYTFFQDLTQEIPEIPADSIVSRTIYNDERIKVVLFGFAPGQELSEHTASMPALVHIVQGEARLTLGQDDYQVQAGAWTRMPANLRHALLAKTQVVMLLVLLKKDKHAAANPPVS